MSHAHARYGAYIDSGVEWLGEVPAHWAEVRIKNIVANLESGVSVNASDEPVEGDNIGVLKTSCVGKGTFLPNQNKSVWSTEIERVCAPVRAGSIIISRMNTPELVGASSYIPKDYPNLFLPDRLWQTVFFKNIKLNSKWLSWSIGCSAFRFLLSTLATGTSPSMKNLGQEKLLSIRIPLPLLSEQTAIAAYLDEKTAQLDRKIDLLSQKATQYGKLKQSLINETVTRGLDKTVAMKNSGVEWIGEVPPHWKVKRVKDELNSLDHKRIPLSGEDRGRMAKQTYDYYGASGIIDKVENYIFDEPTILLGEDGANLYSRSTPLAFIASGKYWVNNHAHILKPRKGDISFFCYLLEATDYTPLISGSAQPKLTAGQLNRILLMVPPLAEQQAIATYLNEKTTHIDRIVATLNTQIDKLKELRKTLINDIVTGKICIFKQEASHE